jgi:glycosyltransferase involved in cell wall biosynthesis
MPGVSIALATFNGEKYLSPQLASLAGQTVLPAELVICDDGSVDRTIALAQEFAESAPFPVRIIRNESGLGYRANFMRAAAFCRLELIAFCDQDDVWEPDKLAVMEPLFHDPEVLLAYHNAVVIDEHETPIGQFYAESAGGRTFGPLALDPWSLVPGFVQVFRRSLLRFASLRMASVDPYWPAESLAHDQWQLFLASILGSIVRIGQPLARYRQHPNNAFGWTDGRWLEASPGHTLRAESFVAAAQNRAELLRSLPGDLSPVQRARVDRAIAYYDDLHRLLNDRIAIYASAGLAVRAAAFRALLRRGAYGQAGGSVRFGWKGLLMDAFGGVPFGPAVRRMLQ